jgi:hypothetical protein
VQGAFQSEEPGWGEGGWGGIGAEIRAAGEARA